MRARLNWKRSSMCATGPFDVCPRNSSGCSARFAKPGGIRCFTKGPAMRTILWECAPKNLNCLTRVDCCYPQFVGIEAPYNCRTLRKVRSSPPLTTWGGNKRVVSSSAWRRGKSTVLGKNPETGGRLHDRIRLRPAKAEFPCLNRISRYRRSERIAMRVLELKFVSFRKIDLRRDSAAYQDITQKGDAKSYCADVLNKETTRLKESYESLRHRYDDILDRQDLKNIFAGDSEYDRIIKFTKFKRNLFSGAWLLYILILGAVVMVLAKEVPPPLISSSTNVPSKLTPSNSPVATRLSQTNTPTHP